MRHTFQAEQWLPYPVELVFAFFVNPQNLPPLMPGWQKARVEEAALVSPPAGGAAKYRLRGVAAGAGSNVLIVLYLLWFLRQLKRAKAARASRQG